MPVKMKPFRMMYADLLMSALEELKRENELNATRNSSLPARAVSAQIADTYKMVESQMRYAEEMRYPEMMIVALNDSDAAVIEWAIVEFAYTVHRNFSEGQHYRNKVDEMVKEFDDIEWRMGPVR